MEITVSNRSLGEPVSLTSREPRRANIFGNAFSRIQAVLTNNMLATTSPDFQNPGTQDSTFATRHDICDICDTVSSVMGFLGLLGFESSFNDTSALSDVPMLDHTLSVEQPAVGMLAI